MNKYSFKLKFLSDIMEIANEFPANPSSRDIVASLRPDDKIDIFIQKNKEKNSNNYLFDVIVSYSGNEIAAYSDNGITNRYMKMLSKVMTIAMMASILHIGQSFKLQDKNDRCIFVSAISVYGRNVISIGNNRRIITLKDVNSSENIVDEIAENWLKNAADEDIIDYKSLLIIVPSDVMSLADFTFSKSYVVFQ